MALSVEDVAHDEQIGLAPGLVLDSMQAEEATEKRAAMLLHVSEVLQERRVMSVVKPSKASSKAE